MWQTMLTRPLVALAILFFAFLQVQADNDKIEDPRFGALSGKIESLVMRHYPKAICSLSKNMVRFESDTQPFMVHVPLKTGEWQEPREVIGPKQKGILGSVQLRKGRFLGAAKLPQTFDNHYFSDMVSAPYSVACDFRLDVHLLVPRFGRNNEFIKEFHDLVNSVERWQECGSERPSRQESVGGKE